MGQKVTGREHRSRPDRSHFVFSLALALSGSVLAAALYAAVGGGWWLFGAGLAIVGAVLTPLAIARGVGTSVRTLHREVAAGLRGEPTTGLERLAARRHFLWVAGVMPAVAMAVATTGAAARLGAAVWAGWLGAGAAYLMRPKRHRFLEDWNEWGFGLTVAAGSLVGGAFALAGVRNFDLTTPQAVIATVLGLWMLLGLAVDRRRPRGPVREA